MRIQRMFKEISTGISTASSGTQDDEQAGAGTERVHHHKELRRHFSTFFDYSKAITRPLRSEYGSWLLRKRKVPFLKILSIFCQTAQSAHTCRRLL